MSSTLSLLFFDLSDLFRLTCSFLTSADMTTLYRIDKHKTTVLPGEVVFDYYENFLAFVKLLPSFSEIDRRNVVSLRFKERDNRKEYGNFARDQEMKLVDQGICEILPLLHNLKSFEFVGCRSRTANSCGTLFLGRIVMKALAKTDISRIVVEDCEMISHDDNFSNLLQDFQGNTSLHTFQFVPRRFGIAGLKSLSGLTSLKSLKICRFDESKDVDPEAVNYLENLKNLEYLAFDEETFPNSSMLKNFYKAHKLYCENPRWLLDIIPIDQHEDVLRFLSLHPFSFLTHLTKLKALHGVKGSCFQFLGCSPLESLSAYNVTDEQIARLSHIASLRHLNVSGCENLTLAAFENLKKIPFQSICVCETVGDLMPLFPHANVRVFPVRRLRRLIDI